MTDHFLMVHLKLKKLLCPETDCVRTCWTQAQMSRHVKNHALTAEAERDVEATNDKSDASQIAEATNKSEATKIEASTNKSEATKMDESMAEKQEVKTAEISSS